MGYRDIIYSKYREHFQASGYKRADLSARWARAYGWFLRDWLPKTKDARILDIGCGGGELLHALKIRGFTNAEGIDYSQQQVEAAVASGLKVCQGDVITSLREDARQWDLILAIDILEHLTKDEVIEIITLVYRRTAPNGRIVIQMPNPNALGGMRIRYGDLTHEICLSPDCMERLLALFGYRNIQARETGPVISIFSPLAAVRWVLWQLIRGLLVLVEVVETGACRSKIFTRVYLISAQRSASE